MIWVRNYKKMNILITNDDGIFSEGLQALYKIFAKKHSVTIIAPDRERSAVGHGITLDKPIRVTKHKLDDGHLGYALSGTPVDCIKLGVVAILDSYPDMVVSGINPGANLGVNINYSGTVCAAKEAALYGIPAIAVSVYGNQSDNYYDAAIFIEKLTEQVFKKGLPFGTFLNVNIPNTTLDKVAGVRISRHDNKLHSEYFEKRVDPRNHEYYWQGCDTQIFDNDLDIDGAALRENFISITPVKSDATNYGIIDDLKGWDI